MPRFVVERAVPGAGALSTEELRAISRKTCAVLKGLGPQAQWVQGYVAQNTIYCVHLAPDEASIRPHADRGGFPADAVAEVRCTIDPTTAE